MNPKFVRYFKLAVAVIFGLAATACTELRFISDYDEYTDSKVTVIQRSVERIFTDMEREPEWPDCSHESNEDRYKEIAVELNVLIARNELRLKNVITTDQLKLLKDSMGDLETLHKDASAEKQCLSIEEVSLMRAGFSGSFGAILRLELAKKRNDVNVN